MLGRATHTISPASHSDKSLLPPVTLAATELSGMTAKFTTISRERRSYKRKLLIILESLTIFSGMEELGRDL